MGIFGRGMKSPILVLAACLAASLTLPAKAQQGGRQRPGGEGAGRQAPAAQALSGENETGRGPLAASTPLPPDKTTSHSLKTDSGDVAFTATAGTIPLFNEESGSVSARLGFIAFTQANADARTRPVTFVWNGGPGYASAWLNLGALGPWRLDMESAARTPSLAPALADNPQSWLTFSDLVFIDPAGTGFGRIPGGEDARKALWSVNGDISSIAAAVRRWLVNNGRMSSPKFLAGESYGGFRAPKVARQLLTEEGAAINGTILISPVLDFGRFRSGGVLSHVARLPSYAATAMEKSGAATPAQMAQVEAYAQGEFLSDLMKGYADAAALERLSGNVARLTGLDRSLVAKFGGRIGIDVFAREVHAVRGRVASIYDGSFAGLDPNPFSRGNEADDQLLKGLHAPLVSAMIDLYRTKLDWLPPNAPYRFHNPAATQRWDWGGRNAEAVSDLSRAMALDANMRTLVVHGLTDLVTPYFETKMVLNQMPPPAGGRLAFKTYGGGHMFYSREESRRAFRDDAAALVKAATREP